MFLVLELSLMVLLIKYILVSFYMESILAETLHIWKCLFQLLSNLRVLLTRVCSANCLFGLKKRKSIYKSYEIFIRWKEGKQQEVSEDDYFYKSNKHRETKHFSHIHGPPGVSQHGFKTIITTHYDKFDQETLLQYENKYNAQN